MVGRTGAAVPELIGRSRRGRGLSKFAAVFAVFVTLSAPAASPAIERDDLTRVPWMQPESTLADTLPVDICVDVPGGGFGNRLCAGDVRVGRVPARGYFWFVRGRLAQLNLVFSSSAFDEVVGAISKELGQQAEPTIERRRSGAITFTNQVRDWRGRSMSARVSRNYFGYHGDAQAWLVAGRGVADADGALRYSAD